MTVHAINPKADEAKRVRRILFECLRQCLTHHGDDLRGFAIVAWDQRGAAISSNCTATGPISESLMPAYVHDVLLKQVTADLVARNLGDETAGSDPVA